MRRAFPDRVNSCGRRASAGEASLAQVRCSKSDSPPVRLNELMSSTSITIYGVCAVSFMMAMYALEKRGRQFIFLFALGCLLSSAYGFLSGAWPFGVVEVIWCGIALRRWHGTADMAQ